MRALVEPNVADVFAHIFFEPSRREHRRALQWLRNAPVVRALVSEVWDDTIEEDIIRHFGNATFSHMVAEDRRYRSPEPFCDKSCPHRPFHTVLFWGIFSGFHWR